MSKRATSGESMEPGGHDQSCSPRSGDAAQQGQQAQHRSHGISAKALHHGATAYPSEMQLQQVELGSPSALKLNFRLHSYAIWYCMTSLGPMSSAI